MKSAGIAKDDAEKLQVMSTPGSLAFRLAKRSHNRPFQNETGITSKESV